MNCTCGHDFFDHRAVADESRSGEVQLCRFASSCGCEGFTEEDDT